MPFSTSSTYSCDSASSKGVSAPTRSRRPGKRRRHRVLRQDVEQMLAGLRNTRICYWKNPGNAGDALLHQGTLDALRRAGVTHERVEAGDDVTGRVVLLGGGGNLVPAYDHADMAFRSFRASDARRIVVLPHGIRGHGDTLRLALDGDVFMCRDAVATEHVLGSGTAATVRAAHDMAFHLDVHRLRRDRSLATKALPVLEHRLALHGWQLANFGERDEMCFTRIDGERSDFSPPTDIDISHHLIMGESDEDSAISAWCLLTCIRHCRQVTTDRLHVAIGAALTGTRVRLLANSYDKNRSVFDMSLSMFPSVEFCS